MESAGRGAPKVRATGYALTLYYIADADHTRAREESAMLICRFSDARFRRTAALFWGKLWGLDHFQRQIKDSRKVEDIILPFVTTATKSLKDDNQLADGAW